MMKGYRGRFICRRLTVCFPEGIRPSCLPDSQRVQRVTERNGGQSILSPSSGPGTMRPQCRWGTPSYCTPTASVTVKITPFWTTPSPLSSVFLDPYFQNSTIRDNRISASVKSRAQKVCESRGGRPGLPVPNSPYGLCGRKATLNPNSCHCH